MLDFIDDILKYDFLRNALLASICLGVTCGIVGVYIVVRRMVFLSGGVTHASFGGIGIAYYLGLNPTLGALVFSVASMLGMQYLTSRMKIREDSAIGVLWAIGMAVGIIFVFLTPGYTPNLMSFLFGNILTINKEVLFVNLFLAIILLAVFVLFYRVILNTAFDANFASTQRIPVKIINSIAMIFIAVTIVMTIKLIGIMLLVSMLTLPPITANLFTSSYKKMTYISMVITVICNVLGLFISYATSLPSGASIIIVLTAVYCIVKAFKMVYVKQRQH